MSSNQPYRDRGGGGGGGGAGGDREANYRSGYNNRGGGGGFRGRGGVGGYKPRRYWDNDEYYKEDRDHGGRGRRRRSYSRSRSRSRSYSSRSRSRSRSPPPRRGRSRSPQKPEEVSERPPEQLRHVPPKAHEPYVPTKEPSNAWSNSRMQLPQEYLTQTNGQAPVIQNQINPHPYSGIDTTAYPSHYQEAAQQGVASLNNPPPMGYTYGQSTNLMSHPQYQPQQSANLMFPHGGISQPTTVAPPPPLLSETKSTKDEGSSEGSKKKKDKRKKKKRHQSSSSSSSSSDDSSESKRRHKSKKDQGSSDSSSDEEKKDSKSSSGLTTAQKDQLLKQREGYQTKLEILEREIAKLQNKEDELIRSRADRQLIEENLTLQAELKGRCKAVLIVLEKIDDVLKVKNKVQQAPVEKPRPAPPQEVPQPQQQQPAKIDLPRSESRTSVDGPRKGSFDYFDNGQHWCRLCNVFPETVEQMLTHFHSKEHHDQIQQLGIDEKPWHKRNSVTETKPVSGARKAPFRGMQFFSPVEGWYCRLCNSWMGDPHCAVDHLKSDDHNSNYMNFLEEHPDWEHKWVSDREKALGVSGKQDTIPSTKKSRFDDSRGAKDKAERKPVVVSQQEDLESGKSIRVQMRNSLKGEERSNISQFSAAPLNEAPVPKDSGLDEWMSKPKVTVDIIDTQKFAAIVRQKHGAKEKEVKDGKADVVDVKASPPVPPSSSLKEKDYKKEKDDRRRTDKVELQISSRDKDRDRDRYRERDNRGSRRRSRSRSRSRSRDRRYSRRRSRSRSRDRSDRDRRDRGGERERPEFKEAVKKLPMIGKMPLYKRPAISREKPDIERSKVISAEVSPVTTLPTVGFLQKEVATKNKLENVSLYNENSMSSAYMYDAHSSFDSSTSKGRYDMSSAYGQVPPPDVSMEEDTSKDFQQGTEMSEDVPSEDLKEAKEGTPAALPDDFQQALDIIYAVNTAGALQKSQPSLVPQPVPPPGVAGMAPTVPGTNGVSNEHSAAVGTEYGDYSANGYGNYMDYQPYQQSFDGYAPVGYDELDDGPPGVGDENPSVGLARPPPIVPPPVTEISHVDKVVEKDPPPPGDDDMEDLRMLGIDVDDTAVVLKH